MPIKKLLAHSLTHALFQPDRAQKKFLLKHCSNIHNKKILEIGSGKSVKRKFIYSVADFFRKNSNRVFLSDANPRLGHSVIDITKSCPRGFDVIVCFSVLEHVFDFHKAISNMHKSLGKNGQLLVLVPAFYPLHDEPNDYWRFTEHSLRKLFSSFKKIEIDYYGKREFPFFYFVSAIK